MNTSFHSMIMFLRRIRGGEGTVDRDTVASNCPKGNRLSKFNERIGSLKGIVCRIPRKGTVFSLTAHRTLQFRGRDFGQQPCLTERPCFEKSNTKRRRANER